MAILVQKYGGTSLAGPGRLRAVAQRVASAGRNTVVVVSARGDTTDRLLDLAGEAGGHHAATRAARETDQLLATGEYMSAALLALALERSGVRAVSLTGHQAGIRVVGRHGAGVIDSIDTRRVRRELAAGRVVVVGGFQGSNAAGDVVTLGRGGSDTTAVALAAALGARRCEIYTDVEGVYTADPRLVASARKLRRVPAEVMVEMAFSGAKVLHARSAELALAKGVELHVRSSLVQAEGTVVHGGEVTELETGNPVTAVTSDSPVARVLVHARDGRDLAPEILALLAGKAVPGDLVARSGPYEDEFRMGFTIARDAVELIRGPLESVAAAHGGGVLVDADVAKVSLIGVGLLNRPEYLARMAAVLSDAGIPTCWVASSQARASVVVAGRHRVEALRLLHKEFGLADGD
ncbi:aspartate kinase [Streptomyces litchfieldiae]|uniref:Aspartokinase n=1 Tax=Streptomyces litchfieldiae TaxID=3075543 RepID=A0ABU2MRF8_9ACTN|nr:aspartate kinase [Streptomyces sp. DSM 44938]MDT0344056.1 aspartate kinase [Streptomyces sp. DSM 44938]